MGVKTDLEPSLKDLSSSISQDVNTISEYLSANCLPAPTFKPGCPDGLPLDKGVQVARHNLIENAMKLLHLATGPEDYIRWSIFSHKLDQFVITALDYFNFWDAVPMTGSIPYSDLAKKVNLSEFLVRRILRHAYTTMLFYETSTGEVAHTSTTAVMVKYPELRAWVAHHGEENGNAMVKEISAIEQFPDSDDPNETGFALAWGDNVFGLFDKDVGDLEKHPERTKGWRARRFGQAMKSMNTSGAHSQKFIHEGFDWDSLGECTMVDMGGSTGHISRELAEHHPKMTFIIQDLPAMESSFTSHTPSNLASRMTFQPHDFFTPQTVRGADIYFLKHILHDWADNLCVKILQQIIPAMTPGKSRIVIMDGIMPEYGEVPTAMMRLQTCMDLQMMGSLNAKERTAKDWEALMKAADPRLRIKDIKVPFGSAAGVIEVVFEEAAVNGVEEKA